MRRSIVPLVLLSAGTALRTCGATDLHGFVETAVALSTTGARGASGSDYVLQEARVQLRASAASRAGEAFARIDVVEDGVVDGAETVELREAFVRFTALSDHLEVKSGRQALTWGTGDLLFVNDLFPKDWISFFAGREDAYLKAPVNAVRLGIFGLPLDVEIVAMPRFAPDRLPDGERLPRAPTEAPAAPSVQPARTFENGELAARLVRLVGTTELAAYFYRGFTKAPAGVRGEGETTRYHPALSVYGASARGPLAGGVFWLEGGLYDSREDPGGDDPGVPNGSLRALAGYERQLATDFTGSVQLYREHMLHHESFVSTRPPGSSEIDEVRHTLTLRLEKLMYYQTLRFSVFTFASPENEEIHVRALVSYRMSDELEVGCGVNVFEAGVTPSSGPFGAFDAADNVFARVRYGF